MFKRCLIIISAITMMMFSWSGCKSGKFDILVKNGKIIDGTGNPWFYGDIGIIGDTIAEIQQWLQATVVMGHLRLLRPKTNGKNKE